MKINNINKNKSNNNNNNIKRRKCNRKMRNANEKNKKKNYNDNNTRIAKPPCQFLRGLNCNVPIRPNEISVTNTLCPH